MISTTAADLRKSIETYRNDMIRAERVDITAHARTLVPGVKVAVTRKLFDEFVKSDSAEIERVRAMDLVGSAYTRLIESSTGDFIHYGATSEGVTRRFMYCMRTPSGYVIHTI